MATFRVGQRVRIVRAGLHAELIGREATVTAPWGIQHGHKNGWHDCYLVRVDGAGGEEFCAQPEDLTPLQPERNTVVSWESLRLPFDPRRVLEGVS